MISEKIEWRLAASIFFLFATAMVAAILIVRGQYVYLLLVLPVLIWQLVAWYRSRMQIRRHLRQFLEAVRYGDYTTSFSANKNSGELPILREGLNTINQTFRKLSKEKETQHQYLQNILSLIDTGILSFNIENGEVAWMNEAMKKMLELPYLKTISSLEKRNSDLLQEIINIKPGQSKVIVVDNGINSFKVLLSATSFRTHGSKYLLLAFQNINEAIEETETEAWRKLLSVLTHEIMNSIAPISSLAETMTGRLQDMHGLSSDETVLEDIELSIKTIKSRSDGLLKFAEAYRSLNKTPTPELKKIYARDLFENLYSLMQPTLTEKNIEMEIILKDPGLYFEADVHLIEQVLINLMMNAIEAVRNVEHPRIAVAAYKETSGKTVLRISDNGGGIPEDLIDKIFIPFFTTKKNGTGIGLTLCKQIMLLHHGNIEARNIAGGQTHFFLTL